MPTAGALVVAFDGLLGAAAAVLFVSAGAASATFFLVGISAFRSVGPAAFVAAARVDVCEPVTVVPAPTRADGASGEVAIAAFFAGATAAVLVIAGLAAVGLGGAGLGAVGLAAAGLAAAGLLAAGAAAALAGLTLAGVAAASAGSFATREAVGFAALVRFSEAGCAALRAAALDCAADLALAGLALEGLALAGFVTVARTALRPFATAAVPAGALVVAARPAAEAFAVEGLIVEGLIVEGLVEFVCTARVEAFLVGDAAFTAGVRLAAAGVAVPSAVFRPCEPMAFVFGGMMPLLDRRGRTAVFAANSSRGRSRSGPSRRLATPVGKVGSAYRRNSTAHGRGLVQG